MRKNPKSAERKRKKSLQTVFYNGLQGFCDLFPLDSWGAFTKHI
jgi:hypothetical protein